ncbi:unnamed protein product [Caenorhabditis sp. 36 PRJEB53466]|nr:unnamed protein product [Caenorhabditis sp. 36 PRJEB53466]
MSRESFCSNSSEPSSNSEDVIIVDESEKERIINQGLPLDWLVRSNVVSTPETLIYLSQQREKWIHEDQKLILFILQEYDRTVRVLIPENDPSCVFPKRNISVAEKLAANCGDSKELYDFTCRLLELVREEPVLWDRQNSPFFGYHQPMRRAWCSISLKLGGWGSIQHVHMLKQYYRRKRDQFNIDHLRLGRPFLYSEQLDFLKNILEMARVGKVPNGAITIEEHVHASAPDIEFEQEILEAPTDVQFILKKVTESIDEIAERYPPAALAEYLTLCCNEVVKNREDLATAQLHDCK